MKLQRRHVKKTDHARIAHYERIYISVNNYNTTICFLHTHGSTAGRAV